MKNNHYVLLKAPWGDASTCEARVKGGLWNEVREEIGARCLEVIGLGQPNEGTQFVMLIDDGRKICDPPKPVNVMATALYQLDYRTEDYICGDAVIAIRHGEEIEPLSKAVADSLASLVAVCEKEAIEEMKEEAEEGPKMAF